MTGALVQLAERFPPPAPATQAGFVTGAAGRFERLVQRHHARLRRAAAGILGDPDRVDDVLQEAYLKAYRRLPPRFANEAHEAAWLSRVVVRCCLDEARRTRRRHEQPLDDVEEPVSLLENRLAQMDVDRAFRRLSMDDRAVLMLVDLLGLDYVGAAKALRVRRGTVASRLNAARRRLREALVSEGVPHD